jgi:hypothetical protein
MAHGASWSLEVKIENFFFPFVELLSTITTNIHKLPFENFYNREKGLTKIKMPHGASWCLMVPHGRFGRSWLIIVALGRSWT